MLPPFPRLRQGHPGYVLQKRLEHPSLEKLTTHIRKMAFFCWRCYPQWESMLATHLGQGFSPCHNWHFVSNNSLLWGDVPLITESLAAWLLSLTYQESYNLFRLKNVSSGRVLSPQWSLSPATSSEQLLNMSSAFWALPNQKTRK